MIHNSNPPYNCIYYYYCCCCGGGGGSGDCGEDGYTKKKGKR